MTHRPLPCKRTLSLFAAVMLVGAGCRSKPVDPQALLTAQSLGLRDLQRGMLAEAEQQFKKVVSLAPSDPLGYANLGLTYLRGSRYAEAETQLRRAQKLNPRSVEVGLILAKLYAVSGRPADARKTLEELSPDAPVLYALAELDSSSAQHGDSAASRRYEERLRQALSAGPTNLAVRLELVDALLRRGSADSALHHLEEVRRLRPESPKEAKPALDSTIEFLRAGTLAESRGTFNRFVRAVELTTPYQESFEKVKWVEGPLVGRPVLEFNPQSLITTRGFRRVGNAEVRFTDVTAEAGLSTSGIPTALATGDYDGNGTDNLFVSLAQPGGGQPQPVVRAYNVQRGYVADVTSRAGISLPAGARYATFADFDNDGWLDLYVIGGDGRGYLLRNNGKGGFDDVSAKVGLTNAWGSRKALFVDIDHDGDLDLLLIGGATNRLYQNNLDGTFTEIGDAAGLRSAGVTNDAAFGDFDGDGRIDVVLAGATGVRLFRKTGLLHFQNVSAASGLASGTPAGRLAVGDYDNDGRLDIFAANVGLGEPALWRNEGDGKFTRDQRATAAFERLGRAGVVDAEFVDYDNDGRLDLVATGRRGVLLFRNEGAGRFSDRTNLLPATLQSAGRDVAARSLAVSDVDADGDEDLFVSDSAGVHLLRNDGGNSNLAMQVQLVGLRTGSGKNNTFGIGSKIEVRAGEIYQTQVVTGRVTHFGLGPHFKADVLRVEWTNGVPQTIYFPGTDADVLELEQLKGSCAFLYTWDGKQFRFVTDVMWRSALGMPLGIMGNEGGGTSKTYAPAGASQEYLRIPGDALQPRNGRYVLQLTEELWETAFLDEVRLLAVDHPDSVDVFVDERFVPPGPVKLRLFHAAGPRAPVSANDDRGRNVLPALRYRDDIYVSDFTPTAYQGLVEPHDLVLDLGDAAGNDGTFLFLRGWIYPTDASINVALSQNSTLKAVVPSLEVRNARGEWETSIASIGFPSGKDKTIVVDLAGRFPTRDHRVRIRTNMQISWDQAFVATDASTSPVRTTPLRAASANLHFRGFSRMYRRGGAYGPHWFAYGDVSTSSPWRTIQGAFTRFGDVAPLLGSADDMYAVMAPGDEATVEFDAASAPAVPPGWKRTFLLYSDGWIKDADLNTAFGNTVAPLPFHSITSYPYAPGDSYPADPAHTRYLREFNTRVIRR